MIIFVTIYHQLVQNLVIPLLINAVPWVIIAANFSATPKAILALCLPILNTREITSLTLDILLVAALMLARIGCTFPSFGIGSMSIQI